MIKLHNGKHIRVLDKYNWVVGKMVISEKGVPYEKVEGYYPTFGSALYDHVETSLKESEIKTFKQILKKLDEIKKTEPCVRVH